jgi:hypothetical protein
MDSPGAAKGGSGAHNWGGLGDDYGQADYEAMDYTPEEIASLQRAQAAEQNAAAREYYRAEEAQRMARDEFVRGQQARKAALERHAAGNPYAALYMKDEKGADFGPPLDFAFGAPRPMARPSSAIENWDAALAEDRKIRRREGLTYPAPPPAPHPMDHPAMGHHLAAAMPVSVMERALHHEEHIRHMRLAQAAHQYQARHHYPVEQQPYSYGRGRGPHDRYGQTFQPRGHARFGH